MEGLGEPAAVIGYTYKDSTVPNVTGTLVNTGGCTVVTEKTRTASPATFSAVTVMMTVLPEFET